MIRFVLLTLATCNFISGQQPQNELKCLRLDAKNPIPKRRYDITRQVLDGCYEGWADVQQVGGNTDYCRVITVDSNVRLACALGGTSGESDMNFHSGVHPIQFYKTKSSKPTEVQFMKDIDKDGRDDFCWCNLDSKVECLKAGLTGFEPFPDKSLSVAEQQALAKGDGCDKANFITGLGIHYHQPNYPA